MSQASPHFRGRLIDRVPTWLKGTIIMRVLYTIALHIDVVGDLVKAALTKRFQTPDNYDALNYLGQDRKMIRGPAESDATYAARLSTWLDAHRTRGGPYALLRQLYLYYAPNNFPIELVYGSTGLRFLLDTSGNITDDRIAWRSPDSNLAQWARWYLFYHWPTPVPAPGVWDDGALWDDGGVWDSGFDAETVAQLVAIPKAWNAAHCLGTIYVMSPGAELWNYPPSIWDDGGTWNQGAGANVAVIGIS